MYDSLSTVLRSTRAKSLLGEGSCRKVYDLKNGYVLKVAKNQKGLKECANEYHIFNSVPKRFQKFLCPVIQFEDKYVLMPRIASLPPSINFKTILEKNSNLIQYLARNFDIDEFELSFEFNWGFYQDNAVLIDYGHTFMNDYIKIGA